MPRTVRPEDIIDIKPIGEKATVGEILDFATDVALGTAKSVISGTVHTAADTAVGCLRLCRGDFQGATDVVTRRVGNIVNGAVGAIESTAELAESGYDAVVKDAPFMTEANKIRLTRLCRIGVYAAAGGVLSEDGIPDADGCSLHGDACTSLPGVENGVFVGDASDLDVLVRAGELPDAESVPAEEVLRSATVRAEFLHAHGIEDTEGWQVHHIQPISAGGADTPENMVLVDADTHAEITAAHRDYYGWTKKV